ncbi:MAG: zf-HC2 domain-containing protein [Gemmatimonadota bacterium]
MREISREDLMRYLDGELPSTERQAVEEALAGSTELQREIAIFRAMKEDFRELSFQPHHRLDGIWDEVSRRLARPVGWILFTAGAALWAGYGAYVFYTSPGQLLEKLSTGAVVIGILLLLASVIWEQYRDWLSDPYKDVHR